MVFSSEVVMGKIEGTVALGMFGAGYVAGNLATTMNMQLTMIWISSVIGNVWLLTSSLIHFACIGVVSPQSSSRGETTPMQTKWSCRLLSDFCVLRYLVYRWYIIYYICHDLQLVIYQARMQQSEDTCTHLREELSRTKQECMQLQGMKQGLHQRLSEQQQEILQVGVCSILTGMCDSNCSLRKQLVIIM